MVDDWYTRVIGASEQETVKEQKSPTRHDKYSPHHMLCSPPSFLPVWVVGVLGWVSLSFTHTLYAAASASAAA